MTRDPLDSLSDGNDLSGRARRAFLVGGDPKSKDVYYGVKLAFYWGKSINRYDLTTNKRVKKNKDDFSAEKQMEEAIAYYIRVGHEVEHPKIGENSLPEWVAHFKKEAKRLGLNVTKGPS